MKRYFVLALALVVFAIAPVMADVAISGEYDMSGVWNTGDEEYAADTDKMEFDVKATLDDYNTFKFELEEDGNDHTAGKASILDEPLTINYIELTTDWGKYFGFADKGFGMTTSVGLKDFGYSEMVDFTGYELEYSDRAYVNKNDAMRVDFDIMGIVKPYYAMNLDTYQAGSQGASWLIGSVVDLNSLEVPVAIEAYFVSNNKVVVDGDDELNKMFGVEALYSDDVVEGVTLTAGAHFLMTYADYSEFTDLLPAYDEWWSQYGIGVGASAYGATVNLSMRGYFVGSDADDAGADGSYAFSMLGIDADYEILEWLGINGGMLFAMGDYATDMTEDETFLGAEFGLYLKPGKGAKYSLGYIAINEDAGGNYISLTPDSYTEKGGLYFKVNVDY